MGIFFIWSLLSLLWVQANRKARRRGQSVWRRQLAGVIADWIVVAILIYLLFTGGYRILAGVLIALWLGIYVLGSAALGIVYLRRRRARSKA